MIRRSHSAHPSESGTDWSQQSLLPDHLKRKPKPITELPAVEVDPVPEAEDKRVETPAIHMTMEQLYEQEVSCLKDS